MKALSLWQPWASAISAGLKRNETRGWCTPHRGLIAIHAAKATNGDLKSFFADKLANAVYAAAFARLGISSWADLPLGQVIATADLVDCRRTELFNYPIGSAEYEWGNYEHGRYAWMLEDIVPLAEPIAAVGMQGLWEWKEAS